MAMSEKPGPDAPAWKMKKWLRRHPEDRVVAEEKQPEPPEEPVHEPSPAVKATKKKAAKKKASKKKPKG